MAANLFATVHSPPSGEVYGCECSSGSEIQMKAVQAVVVGLRVAAANFEHLLSWSFSSPTHVVRVSHKNMESLRLLFCSC
jgi:hypothetical protein